MKFPNAQQSEIVLQFYLTNGGHEEMEEKKLMLTTDSCNNEDVWRGKEMKEETVIMSTTQIKHKSQIGKQQKNHIREDMHGLPISECLNIRTAT